MTRAFTASRRQLAQLRLAAQRIDTAAFTRAAFTTAAFTRPAEVVQHMLALQAQDFTGALWSVGLRTRAATDASVRAAIEAREIVRSWPMRGTLHLVPADDLGWMLDLTRERMVRGAAGRHRQLGLDAESFTQAARIAETHLSGGQGSGGLVNSRTDLLAAFDAAGLSTAGQRGAHLLWYLNVSGLLVFGPVSFGPGGGKQHSFVLLDEWVRTGRGLRGDEALAEFARRYFLSHGPASVRDFAWWSSLTLADARRGLAAVTHELEALDVDDVTYWMAPGLEPAAAGVALLPGFDEYVLGYQDRSAQLATEWSPRVVPGNNGIFRATIVVDGEIVGTWKRTVRSTSIDFALEPFEPLNSSKVSSIRKYLARYAVFLNSDEISLKHEGGERIL